MQIKDPISVGLGEIQLSREPEDVLVAYGIGSCLAIGMWEPRRRVAGMLHAVLPEYTNGATEKSPKYVSSGVEALLMGMERLGADRKRIIVRMAGGANMLGNASLAQAFDIGARNIQAAYRTFDRLNLYLASDAVGGNAGRTVRLFVTNGRMTIRTIGSPEMELHFIEQERQGCQKY